MAIDLHSLNFLLYVKKKQLFKKTITIGRQSLYEVDHFLDNKKYKNNDFCEKLLENNFGSTTVDSIDFSDFEGASIVFDMNKSLEEKFYEKYETVLDIGSLEHIFNIPQALKNVSQLCKIGGQIVHVSPANNMCGHGFFQFSPELFFSYYSERNGYYNTEVYLADTTDTKKWFRVLAPNNGNRVNIESDNQLYIMVHTILKNKSNFGSNIQQSDYQFNWKNLSSKKVHSTKLTRIKNKFREFKVSYGFAKFIYNIYKYLFRKNSNRLNSRNKNISTITIASLLK